MRSASFARAFVFAACALSSIVACSDGAPPIIGDSDGGPNTKTDVAIVPCSTPAAGCPCDDAGAQVSCGTIYRISGNHVDCSEGHITCQSDGTWSACVGATVFNGG